MNSVRSILGVVMGLVSWSHNCISVSVHEVNFRPGENITLYCGYKTATGVFTAWFFRYCSHENQSHHVITIWDQLKPEYKFPRLKFIKNDSSESYDLLVINATDSDEGFYYCGTAELKVEKDKDKNIFSKEIYTYGNITTRLKLNTCAPCSDYKKAVEDCGGCWKLLFFLCPAVFLFSVLLSSLLFYLLCHKTGKENQDVRNQPEKERHMEETEDENVCYAALEIHPPCKGTMKKRVIQSSDYRTHTTVKYASNEDSLSTGM